MPEPPVLPGLIVRAQSGFFEVATERGPVICQLRGKLKRGPRTGDAAALGDRVIVGLRDDGTGSIESVEPRRSVLSRHQAPGRKAEQVIVKYFKPEQVIIENVPYRGQGSKVLRPCVEPVMISRLLDATGCGLLFDISHARIAAYYMDTRIEEYFAQMPLSKTQVMHFTGMKWLQGKLTDHVECLDADWQILEWTFSLIKGGIIAHPWMLAFEYGGVGEKFAWRSDPHVIASHIPKLSAMIRTV